MDQKPLRSLQAQLITANQELEKFKERFVKCGELKADLKTIEKTLDIREIGQISQTKLNNYQLAQSSISRIKSQQLIERSILITFLVGSLLIIGGLIMRIKKMTESRSQKN